ncbi:Golgi reassembly-stacking protein 2 [Cylas formicarius]|uniref:Golgi reassembly-stacking protein 2 n=1 Tax=Cylas formicarius TaxID=197179 RepID=UPI0029585BE5|nr:Golgi reassembly-stacking protein 2 [Cylas formicarius]
MGNAESVEIPGGGSDGYHVLRVQENSPGEKAGLQPFFDFIISINGTRLDKDDDTLKQILKSGIGKQLPVTVYSCKTQSVRSVNVEPSDTWGGQGHLGISIRFCSFETAKDNVWHILEVQPNSPADLAGLRPFSDYIISSDSILHESEDLFNLIENHDGVSLKLYVYNCDDDSCREVTITPNSHWGGEGLVGCGIGYGYLHRIPVRSAVTHKQQPTIYKSNSTASTILSNTEPITTTSDSDKSLLSESVTETSNLSTGADKFTPPASTVINDIQSNVIEANTFSSIPPPTHIPQFPGIYTQATPAVQSETTNPLAPPSSIPQFSSIQVPLYPVQTSIYNPNNNQPLSTNVPMYSYSQPQYSQEPVSETYSHSHNVNLSYPQVNAGSEPNQNYPPASGIFPPQGGIQALTYPAIPTSQNLTCSGQTSPTQLIYDPTIAARSAQQLLSGNVSSLGNITQNS